MKLFLQIVWIGEADIHSLLCQIPPWPVVPQVVFQMRVAHYPTTMYIHSTLLKSNLPNFSMYNWIEAILSQEI